MSDTIVKRQLELMLSGKYAGSQWLNSFSRDLDSGSRKLHDAFAWSPSTGEWTAYQKTVKASTQAVNDVGKAEAALTRTQDRQKMLRLQMAQAEADGRVAAVERYKLRVAQTERDITAQMTRQSDLRIAQAKTEAKARVEQARWTAVNSPGNRVIGTAGRGLGYAGAGALLLTGDNAYKAAKFQQLTQQAQAGTFMSDREKNYMSNAVLQIASQTGANPADLLGAYQRAVNTRYHYGQAKNLTEIAIKSALPYGGSVSDTDNALVTTLRNFGIPESKAKALMDTLHVAGNKANILPNQFGDFTSNWGRIGLFAGSVNMKGVSDMPGFMNQAMAVYATLTHTGIGPDLAATQTINLIQRLMKPSAGTSKILANYYRNGTNQAQRNLYGDFSYWGLQNKGLTGIIQDLRDSGIGPGGVSKLIPNLRAAGVNALIGHQNASMFNTLGALQNAPSQHITDALWQKYLNTLYGQLAITKEKTNVAQIKSGQNVTPFLTGFTKYINDHFGPVAGIIGSAPVIAGGSVAGSELFKLLAKHGIGRIFGGGTSAAGGVAKDVEAIAKAASKARQPVLDLSGKFVTFGGDIETAAKAAGRFGPAIGLLRSPAGKLIPVLGDVALAVQTIPTAFDHAFLMSNKDSVKWSDHQLALYKNFAGDMLTSGEHIASALVTGIENKSGPVLHAAGSILDDISSFLLFTSTGTNKHGENVVTWGSHLGGAFASGLKSEIPSVSHVASGVLGAVTNFLHFNSPNPAGTFDPEKSGAIVGQQFGAGITSKTGDVRTAASQVATAASKALNAYHGAYISGQQTAQGYIDGFASRDAMIKAALKYGKPGPSGPPIVPLPGTAPWTSVSPYGFGTGNAPPASAWGSGFQSSTSNRSEPGNAYLLKYMASGTTPAQIGDTDYPSGGKAQRVTLPGGKNASYTVAWEYWDPDTGGHIVLRTPDGGIITLAHMSTMVGMPGDEWHPQSGPSSVLGKTFHGGKYVGMSGAPITSNPNGMNTPGYFHLCIQTDPSGRQYLAWLTTSQMNAQASGNANAGASTSPNGPGAPTPSGSAGTKTDSAGNTLYHYQDSSGTWHWWTKARIAASKAANPYMPKSIKDHAPLFRLAAMKYGIPVQMLEAMAWQESHGGATSDRIMGMPSSYKGWNAQVMGSGRSLHNLYVKYGGDWNKVFAAYSGNTPGYYGDIQTIMAADGSSSLPHVRGVKVDKRTPAQKWAAYLGTVIKGERFDYDAASRGVSGVNVSQLNPKQAMAWYHQMEKVYDLQSQIWDNQAKQANALGIITKRQLKEVLVADHQWVVNHDRTALYKATHGGMTLYGPSNKVVPLKLIGHQNPGLCPEIKKQHATIKAIAHNTGSAGHRAADAAAQIARQQRGHAGHQAKRAADAGEALGKKFENLARQLEANNAMMTHLITSLLRTRGGRQLLGTYGESFLAEPGS